MYGTVARLGSRSEQRTVPAIATDPGLHDGTTVERDTCARSAIAALLELPLGGTAVGTGINSHPDYARKAIALIATKTGIAFVEAANHFEAQAAKDGAVEASVRSPSPPPSPDHRSCRAKQTQ